LNVLAFLRRTEPPDFGSSFSRLRWRRAIPADESREVSAQEPAREAFAGADVWILVRDESALPWPAPRFPVPEPGRVLVATADLPPSPAVHTLRELEASAARPREGSMADAAEAAQSPAIAFRAADFPAVPGETVAGLLDRLTGVTASVEKRRDPAFRAFVFNDNSGGEREEITRHVPAGSRRLLDVGCGAGGSSAGLKVRFEGLEVWGIESDRARAELARGRLDRVLVGDAARVLEGLGGECRTFDAFLFADVLEHLEDPVQALSLARNLAAPGATLVASVPNAGHLSLVRDLVLGRFDPVSAGLADAGHVRWFTKASLGEALEEAGWQAIAIESWPGAPASDSAGFLAGLSDWPGLDRESLMTYQWIAVARPRKSPRYDVSGPMSKTPSLVPDLRS
jgi:2-polyprenyl-3-methyl-5-hydroxy-6-metoxy-1,4-benzoquinol methylase